LIIKYLFIRREFIYLFISVGKKNYYLQPFHSFKKISEACKPILSRIVIIISEPIEWGRVKQGVNHGF